MCRRRALVALKSITMSKTYEQINEKIRRGEAVVLTAEEVSRMALTMSPEEIADRVDVVTTATFGAMCSSGAFVNFGHADPPIRMERIELNGVNVSGGLAAVDTYIGATDCDPANPEYGGGHIIEDLVAGKDILLEAWGKGTDCYPRRHIRTYVNIDTLNEAYLYNPRNAYQNYNVAVNSSERTIHTYMGKLYPRSGNASYSTAGELSPLINDPECRTIGLGTHIFLGGGDGYVMWNGTQFDTSKEVNAYGIPVGNARTIAVAGELRGMSTDFLRGVYYEKYGCSLYVGIGVPIPILDADLARRVSIRNDQIETNVVDYGDGNKVIGRTNYAELRSGSITVGGRRIRTVPVSSLAKAREIAAILKSRIETGGFLLSEPVRAMPAFGAVKRLEERSVPFGGRTEMLLGAHREKDLSDF